MKIYVVTKGCYSDYHIIAATLDEERAKILKDKFDEDCSWDETRIEVYEDSEEIVKPLWKVIFNDKGEVDEVELLDSSYYYGTINNFEPSLIRGGWIYLQVFADTAEAAVKIAAEKRAQYLAEKNGL